MHMNTYLYKKLHSVHHRLYVPYAFGALYNHPLEGFLLDTLGAGIAEYIVGMSTREAMLLFTVSTLKTVDDHCGYSLPYDPLQMFSGNNADYHDIHHQVRLSMISRPSQTVVLTWAMRLGHWHQKQLLTAILHSLGCHPRYTNDEERYRGEETKAQEAYRLNHRRFPRAMSSWHMSHNYLFSFIT